jgi:hypothetical protein
MIKRIYGSQLKKDDVLALPMARTATVAEEPKVGTRYVTFVTEYGKSRVGRYDEVLLEVPE